MSEPIYLGAYQIGFRMAKVYVEDHCGGASFWTLCSSGPDKDYARISVGCGSEYYYKSLACLLHEAMEMIMGDLHVTYRKDGYFDQNASDMPHFHFHHNEFTEICARLGVFMARVEPDFKAAWQLMHPGSNTTE